MNDDNVMRLLSGLGDTLLAPLAGLPEGAHVVQLGCGTGGLSLDLARRRPDLRVTGIDVNAAALDAGRARAAREGLAVDFRRMPMERLDLADGGVDAVISRMGLLMPGTAPFDVASREAARVLRTGGTLSIGTWAELAGSPYTRFGLGVLRQVLPPGAVPAFETAFAGSARPGALEGHLTAAGLRDVTGAWCDWTTRYPSFDAWWAFVAGFGPLKALFDTLDPPRYDEARAVMADVIGEYRTGDGAYELPATARVLTARR
ncbi:class I SAM-dependent methyltransferase [Catenuloplanes atrovinosus]|uniref:SAM-dependent methyltransferase n=1 Tax=Catenuloplanes atrovinosus TaxID=137266 RepID=A0AAE4CAJ7_9ACTN|nr:class I SAM-dependent methyltransferase [Catenuloplanes atrovinosus]MDR7277062.1 SAM-dependent methyltransferase [Catenuloplanes atrovinosus]